MKLKDFRKLCGYFLVNTLLLPSYTFIDFLLLFTFVLDIYSGILIITHEIVSIGWSKINVDIL